MQPPFSHLNQELTMTSRPTRFLAISALLCSALTIPSLAGACDNDDEWNFEVEGNIDYPNRDASDRIFMQPGFDSESELERIKAYERKRQLKSIEEERRRSARRPLSRTFIYRRWPTRMRRRAVLADSSLRRNDRRSSSRPPQYFKPHLNSRKIARIQAALKDESFRDGQLEVILETGERFDLTVSQAIQLVSVLSFDRDRLEALVSLYPSLIDPDNFIEVYALLSFSSDRRELRKRVRQLA